MADQIVFESKSLDDLEKVCQYIIPVIGPGTIFLFDGEMSAGKTTLISKTLRHLNIRNISSPTYAIHQVYDYKKNKIHHLDLHRLETADDIESSGIWDFFQDTTAIFFIEWAQKIKKSNWPLNFKIFQIQMTKNSDQRIIQITQFKN